MQSILLKHSDLTVLKITDIDGVLGLQNTVAAHLPPDKKVYLKSRSHEDYLNIVASGGEIYGLYKGAQLIATALLTFHDSDTYKTDFNQTKQFKDNVCQTFEFGIIGALMVHPLYQSHGFAHYLLSYMLAQPHILMADKIFAETVVGNDISINCFIDNGFAVIGNEFYPPLNAELCLLEYNPAGSIETVFQGVA